MVFHHNQFHKVPNQIPQNDFSFPDLYYKQSPEDIYRVAHNYYEHLVRKNIPEKEAWSQVQQAIVNKYRNNIDGLDMSVGLFKEIMDSMHSQDMLLQEKIYKDALLRSRAETDTLENLLFREDH